VPFYSEGGSYDHEKHFRKSCLAALIQFAVKGRFKVITQVLDALMLAAQAHRDQRRKGSGGEPYVNHLIEVASLLSGVAKVESIELLQAAILHDILEDTATSAHVIEERFGPLVLSYVKGVTDDKTRTLAERRAIQVANIANASEAIKLIKLADHCSNIASLPESWKAERLEAYLNWSLAVATACFDVSPLMATEYKRRFAGAQILLRENCRKFK